MNNAMKVAGQIADNMGGNAVQANTLSGFMTKAMDGIKAVGEKLQLPMLTPAPADKTTPNMAASTRSAATSQVATVRDLASSAAQSGMKENGPMGAMLKALERIEALAAGEGIAAKIKNFPQSRVGADPSSWSFGAGGA